MEKFALPTIAGPFISIISYWPGVAAAFAQLSVVGQRALQSPLLISSCCLSAPKSAEAQKKAARIISGL